MWANTVLRTVLSSIETWVTDTMDKEATVLGELTVGADVSRVPDGLMVRDM
jgi:hypothetical protein